MTKKRCLCSKSKGTSFRRRKASLKWPGGIVVLAVNAAGTQSSEIQAEFATLQRDSKKTALKFNIKGDNEKASAELYRLAGMNVELSLQSSQMSIDEFYDNDHEGVQYTVNPDGTVEVDQGQITLEEAAAAAEQAQEQEADGQQGEPSDKVADIAQERKRRGRPRKQDKDEKQEEQPAAVPDDELPPLAGDDDLPF